MYEWQHYLCAMFSDEESHASMEVNELYVHAALLPYGLGCLH